MYVDDNLTKCKKESKVIPMSNFEMTYIAHSHLNSSENPEVIFGEVPQNIHIKLHYSSFCTFFSMLDVTQSTLLYAILLWSINWTLENPCQWFKLG